MSPSNTLLVYECYELAMPVYEGSMKLPPQHQQLVSKDLRRQALWEP